MALVSVGICLDKYGNVWSYHDLADNTSRDVVLGWETHGMRQVSESLILEGVRREALRQILVHMSGQKTLTQKEILEMKSKIVKGVTTLVEGIVEGAIQDGVAELRVNKDHVQA